MKTKNSLLALINENNEIIHKSKTKTMKTTLKLMVITTIVLVASCKKENNSLPGSGSTDTYTSVHDFLAKNAEPSKTYMIDAAKGGFFISPQGTKVIIPANAFVTQSGSAVTGIVNVEFKDIYKKSEMVFSEKPTVQYDGRPLKSGGEFYLNVTSNSNVVSLANGKKIDVKLPIALTGNTIDTAMKAYNITEVDTAGTWKPAPFDSVKYEAAIYVYNLYQTKSWYNCDDPTFFYHKTQTTLTFHTNDNSDQYNEGWFHCYIVFKDVNSVVKHIIYKTGENPYYYAPVGMQCTVVVMGTKDGKLYSSFTPITIGSNQTVNFSMSETTSDVFKSKLNALN